MSVFASEVSFSAIPLSSSSILKERTFRAATGPLSELSGFVIFSVSSMSSNSDMLIGILATDPTDPSFVPLFSGELSGNGALLEGECPFEPAPTHHTQRAEMLNESALVNDAGRSF